MTTVSAGAQRVRRRRERMRAAGLRPVQLWLPETRTVEFALECARQARLIREATTAVASYDAWDDISDTTGWTA